MGIEGQSPSINPFRTNFSITEKVIEDVSTGKLPHSELLRTPLNLALDIIVHLGMILLKAAMTPPFYLFTGMDLAGGELGLTALYKHAEKATKLALASPSLSLLSIISPEDVYAHAQSFDLAQFKVKKEIAEALFKVDNTPRLNELAAKQLFGKPYEELDEKEKQVVFKHIYSQIEKIEKKKVADLTLEDKNKWSQVDTKTPEEVAKQRFGKPYDKLKASEQQDIFAYLYAQNAGKKYVPMGDLVGEEQAIPMKNWNVYNTPGEDKVSFLETELAPILFKKSYRELSDNERLGLMEHFLMINKAASDMHHRRYEELETSEKEQVIGSLMNTKDNEKIQENVKNGYIPIDQLNQEKAEFIKAHWEYRNAPSEWFRDFSHKREQF